MKGGGGRGGTGLKIPTAGLGKKSVELFHLGDLSKKALVGQSLHSEEDFTIRASEVADEEDPGGGFAGIARDGVVEISTPVQEVG